MRNKQMRKRALSILLSVSMALSLLPATAISAFAAEPEDDLEAQVSEAAAVSVDHYEEKLTEWKIAPSAAGTQTGLSAIDDWNVDAADTSEWIDAAVPGTVLGNLLDAGIYDDLFEEDNDGEKNVFFSDNMSRIPMSDFDEPWWYNTQFTLPELEDGEHVNINFQGISYTGEIYVNGHKLSNENITVTSDQELQDDLSILGTGEGYADPDSQTPEASSLTPYPNSVDFEEYNSLFLGSFRHYDVDITDFVNKDGSPNDIKVKVYRPLYKSDTKDNATSGDFTSFWVDWNPQPADSNMGLTGNVIVSVSGAVRLSNPAVAAQVSEELDSAELTFYVDLNNMTDRVVRGVLTGVIEAPDGTVVDTVSKGVAVSANAYCQEAAISYTLEDPELWWPNQYGEQPLYTMHYTFTVGGAANDNLDHRFGVREITAEINTSEKASGSNNYMMQIYVNHQPIVLKGGGYCPTDLYLRHSERSNQAVVDYLKYMGMNMIRDEGKFFDNDLLDLLDENGILLMTGWCCCDRHQNSGVWTKAERFVAYEGLYSQLRNARSHASMAVWFNGSDRPPTEMVEYKYLEIEGKLHWTEMGAISSNGSAVKSDYTGIYSGMHMDATYDSQTPNFYYTDAAGNFGFVSEGGGGAGIPSLETIKRVIPEENLWPYNVGENANVWNYHASRQNFNQFNQITSLIDNTYGASNSLEEYVARAQLFDYDTQRAQYEALSMYRFVSTSGLVNWMLNNAWPIFYWNQFDYYLNPHGSTYGVAKANEPVHIMYDTYNKQVCVINNTLEDYSDLTATLSVYDINGNLISSQLSKTFDLEPVGASEPVDGPRGEITDAKIGFDTDEDGNLVDATYQINGKIEESYGIENVWSYDDIMGALTSPTSDVYFLRLELKDASGKVISYNAYAEPMRSDVAGARHSWSRSAVFQTADLTQLNQLPAVELKISQTSSSTVNGKVIQTLSLTNSTDHVAYGVELKAYTNASKTDLVAPVIYSDNLITLFPGETRVITVTHNTEDLRGNATIGVSCYNNLVASGSARDAANIYSGVDVLNKGTNNLARDAAVTAEGFTGSKPESATAVTDAAKTAALNGKTFVDSNLYTNYEPTGEGSFIIDLGSVQSFDRVMLRWVRSTNTINNRPDHVKLEVSSDGLDYAVLVEDYDNTGAGSTMTNIVLDDTATGRYLRVTPSGHRQMSEAVGLVSGQYPFTSKPMGGGIATVNAATKYTCTGVEVYAFRSAAFLDLHGEGKVTVAGKDYTGDMNANQRVALADTDGTLTLTVVPADPSAAVKVLQDGADITDALVEGVLTLSDVTADTTISVRFGSCTVTFASNGGSDVEPIVAEAGATIAKPADPTRTGYAFGGWYRDSELTVPWNFGRDTVSGSMTLYAKWTEVSQSDSDFSQKLTEWKIAPTAGNTHTYLPALKNDAAVADPAFKTDNWVDAVVPGTVLGNLLDAGIYDDLFEDNNDGEKDVFFSNNISKIPYLDFNEPWWYSTSFTLPADQAGKSVNLNFQGISYMAEIYVNGQKLSNENITVTDVNDLRDDLAALDKGTGYVDPTPSKSNPAAGTLAALGYCNDAADQAELYEQYKDEFIGSFRHYDLDITDYVTAGETVNIKVKVTKPVYKNDLTAFWVDWNPEPPDNNMGLTGTVTVSTSGAVRLSNPAVAAKVSEDLKKADLTFYVDANNMTDADVTGKLTGIIRDPDGNVVTTISKSDVTVKASAYCQEIAVTCSVNDPQLWWPYLSGDQPLYTVDYTFEVDSASSDTLHHRFGIREIDARINVSAMADSTDPDELGDEQMLQIYVNHQPVMLRGGGYCPTDLFLRHDQATNEAVVDYLKYMGMNMIRDEGKFFDNDLLDLLDENGILLMTGWCCCDQFQQTPNWRMAERFVAYEEQYSQLRNARQHPSMALWFNGSDNPPCAMVEYAYFRIEAQLHWMDMGAICASGSSAYGGDEKLSGLSGLAGGMHMDAAYDTQTPTFYYTDPHGTFGFVSEGGGGAAIPSLETIQKIIPEANLWPYNTEANYNVWNYHTCRGGFNNLNHLNSFLDNTYGGSESLEEYLARAQIFDYDSQRAQYEAQALFRYTSTAGIVNWMLNNAWPLIYWNQFDFYMNPHGSTFGTAKANEPVHIMYNVYDKDVYVINNTLQDYGEMTASIRLYDINGNPISDELTKKVNVVSDGASDPVPVGTNDRTEIGEQWVGLDYDSETGTYTKRYYEINGQVKSSSGVSKLWSYDDIQASLTGETTDVCFIRLELADSDGKVVSYNSYAEPMRGDVAGASHGWNRSKIFQNADLTQLNQLPNVELQAVQTGSVTQDGKVTQTLKITNPTSAIAYAVELKAYTNASKTDLVAPVLYSDNLITLYPGESREITVTHNVRDLAGDAVIAVSCYNNVIKGEKPETITNIYSGPAQNDAGTYNLARGAEVTLVSGTQSGSKNIPANATSVSAKGQNNAIGGKTFIESDLNSGFSATGDMSFVVDLGAVKAFDRIILRWSTSTGAINVRPDTVKVEISSDNTEWSELTTYDNTKAAAVMTDIALDSHAQARYLRITPSGRMGAVAAFGMVDDINSANGVTGAMTNRSGIKALAAPTVFTCSAVEVYAYAGTQQPTATVTFESNGGSAVDSISAAIGGKLAKPADPTRSGYTFTGWFKDEALEESFDFDADVVNGDMTLYAAWKSNGGGSGSGSGSGSGTTDKFTITVTAGSGGKVDPSGTISVTKGQSKTLTITPDDGYVIKDVVVDGKSVGAVATYTLDKISAAHTIRVSFEKEETDQPTPSARFDDVKSGDWFYDDVMYVADNGIMVGITDSTFDPNGIVNRAMVVATLWRMAGQPEAAAASFTDVPANAWYAKAVAWGEATGVVKGIGQGKFLPDAPVTREQFAAFLYRFAELNGKLGDKTGSVESFADAAQVSGWAKSSVEWAVGAGIITGKNGSRLDPLGTAVRSELAAMLHRYCIG
ncbi:MAG: InlB B-repeat-containing protein [Clostridiales bacterium]|nr:InlB B-repeat-containing protein [Clostridiales bacterium]